MESDKTNKHKCIYCSLTFPTRKAKLDHLHECHADMKTAKGGYKSHRKGKTKDNDDGYRKGSKKLKERYSSGELVGTWTGKKHSEETKKKLSEIRKAYLKEHPEKIPFVLNSKNNGESYPEKYFREWMEKEGIDFKQEYKFELYSLDFLVGDIDFEIDGEQHFINEKRIARDKEREKVLAENGIRTVRVRWANYMKLNQEERSEYLSKLKETLLSGKILPEKLVIKNKNIVKVRGYCKVCGKPITHRGKGIYCSFECHKSTYASKYIPSKEQLIEDCKTMGAVDIGRKYNVSHTTIKRWRKKYNIPDSPRDWRKQNGLTKY